MGGGTRSHEGWGGGGGRLGSGHPIVNAVRVTLFSQLTQITENCAWNQTLQGHTEKCKMDKGEEQAEYRSLKRPTGAPRQGGDVARSWEAGAPSLHPHFQGSPTRGSQRPSHPGAWGVSPGWPYMWQLASQGPSPPGVQLMGKHGGPSHNLAPARLTAPRGPCVSHLCFRWPHRTGMKTKWKASPHPLGDKYLLCHPPDPKPL